MVPISSYPCQCFLFSGFDNNQSSGSKVISLCSFDYISLMTNDMECLFMILSSICMSCMEKCLCKSSTLFELGFCCCCWNVGVSRNIQDINLIRYMVCKYFLQFCRLPFLLLIVSFGTQMFLFLIKFNLPICIFVASFWCHI